jgi:hypothetical protein
MSDPGKFAGVASQYQKDKSHLVQYLPNIADGPFLEVVVVDALD